MEGNRPWEGPGGDYCPQCQQPRSPQDRFCPNCGAPRVVPAGSPSPLGPRDLGRLLEGVYRTYLGGFVAIIILVAVVQVPLSLLLTWSEGNIERTFLEVLGPLEDGGMLDGPEVDPSLVLSLLAEALRQVVPIVLLLVVANLVGSVLMNGAMVHGVSTRLLNGPINVGRAYSFAFGRIGTMLGASLLVAAVVLLLALTILGIPLAVYLGVRWTFVLPVACLERGGVPATLARSASLVQRNWWRVFGILLLGGIAVGLVSGILGGILGLIPYVGPKLGPVVVAVFFAPIMPILVVLLYHDLRVRRDSLAVYTPEVLRAELESREARDAV